MKYNYFPIENTRDDLQIWASNDSVNYKWPDQSAPNRADPSTGRPLQLIHTSRCLIIVHGGAASNFSALFCSSDLIRVVLNWAVVRCHDCHLNLLRFSNFIELAMNNCFFHQRLCFGRSASLSTIINQSIKADRICSVRSQLICPVRSPLIWSVRCQLIWSVRCQFGFQIIFV